MLDTLSSVLHYESPAQGDKSYVEQLLMSAIDNAAQKVEASLSVGNFHSFRLRFS